MKATWNGQVVAESGATRVVEGNHYFPPDAIAREYFKPSATHTICPWKGIASYYTLQVSGRSNVDAAWFYPRTTKAAEHIKGYIAFWRGVDVGE